jgi:hypothetical protein
MGDHSTDSDPSLADMWLAAGLPSSGGCRPLSIGGRRVDAAQGLDTQENEPSHAAAPM